MNTRQSEARTPGRRPPSFGRSEAEGELREDMTIRGGQSLHLVLHLDVTPSAASLEALHAAVAETTRRAVVDGYAAAFKDMDAEAAAGAPPAEPGTEAPG